MTITAPDELTYILTLLGRKGLAPIAVGLSTTLASGLVYPHSVVASWIGGYVLASGLWLFFLDHERSASAKASASATMTGKVDVMASAKMKVTKKKDDATGQETVSAESE